MARTEDFEGAGKRLYREAAKAAEHLLDEARSRIEGTVRTIKEAKAEREKTLRREKIDEFRQKNYCTGARRIQ